MTLIEESATYVARLNYKDLSEEARDHAKIHALDTIGSALLGYHLGYHKPIFDILKGGPPESSVIGEGLKVSCLNASFINSAMINATDYEDTHRESISHPAAVVFPATLAIAEFEKSDGKNFIMALVAGYDILTRIGIAINPSHFNRGFQTTATVGPIGAAAAVGKVMGLNEAAMADALALSAQLGAGFLEAIGKLESKPVQVGRSSQAGVLAALLARSGVGGCHTMLEGGTVMPKAFLGGFSDKYDTSVITRNLGKEFSVVETSIRLHFGCRGTHTPIDAVLECVRKYGVDVNDIKFIKLGVTSAIKGLEISCPNTDREMRFNSAFGIAVALLEKEVSFDKFVVEKLKDPRIRDIMDKISVEVDPKLDQECEKVKSKMIAVAEITTKEGKVYTQRLNYMKGEPENPATKDEIVGKFRGLASRTLGKKRSQEIIALVDRLEELKDISELANLICKP